MDINARVDALVHKIKHVVITTSNHTAAAASCEEFYQALCLALREEIMLHANATIHTIQHKKSRMLNFLSMEYLPGRLLGNNVCNMSANELIAAVLKKMGRDLNSLMSCEADLVLAMAVSADYLPAF